MSIRFYPAIIERSTDGFGVFFPDFDGLASAGDTMEEAIENAGEGLQSHVELMLESGDPLPDPSDLDSLPHLPEVDEAGRVLIRVEFAAQDAEILLGN